MTEASDDRFARLLAYAGLTSTGLPTGVATMAGQRTAGKTLVQALRQVADTEGTVCFVKPDGQFTFHARNHRYWPTSSFTLNASNIDPSVEVRKDTQGLVNDQTATRDGGAEQRAFDQDSIDAYGTADGGSLDVAPSTDYDALQNAAWRVGTGKTPLPRVTSVKVNLLAQTDTALVQSLLSATIGTAFTLTGMPSQTPGGTTMTLFVEGWHEVVGLNEWSIEFYTSPLARSGVSFTSGTSTPTLPNTLRASATADERTKLDAGLKIPF